MALDTREALEAFIDFGIVDSDADEQSKVDTAFNDVLTTIVGDQDDDDTNERHVDTQHFQHSAILHRPADGDDDGEMEVMYVRKGDEMIVFATRDRRFQVSIGKGEVIVRAYGQNAPMLRLDAINGVAYVLAPVVRIEETKDGTVQSMALGDTIQGWMDTVNTVIGGWTVVAMDGGQALQTAWNLAFPSGAPTVTSAKHKVE